MLERVCERLLKYVWEDVTARSRLFQSDKQYVMPERGSNISESEGM